MSYNILVVDDDITQARVIENIIQDKLKYKTTVIDNGKEAIDVLTANDAQDIDLVILDLSMPGVDGVKVINEVKPVRPDLPIIVRTGYDDIDMAVNAMKAGATDFVKKLDEPERLQNCIHNALRIHVLNDEISRLKRTISGEITFSDIIGKSHAVKEMVALAEKVSNSNIPVLIEGKSGVGKELLARAIHAASHRKEKPFIAVNCGAIPDNLVESILFGHEKGAFTGALYKTSGKFREADGGTLFLDEIGELKPDIQVKLLRVLQNGEIEPVGSAKPVKVNVRIISATNSDLSKAIKDKTFREDLFYRLNAFPVHVPKLSERKEDIPLLIEHYRDIFSASEGKSIKGISKKALEMLVNYEWPGNIRQLKNTIFRAIVLCENEEIDTNHFSQILHSMQQNETNQDNKFNPEQPAQNISVKSNDGNFRKLEDIEKDIIKSALIYYKNHMSEVARRLGIGRSTLYRKLDEYGLKEEIPTQQ